MGAAYSRQEKSASEIDESILNFVRSREHVSFIELRQHCEGNDIPFRGNWAVHLGSRDKLILWPGVSLDILSSLRRLIRSRRVFLHPASPLAYAIDGELPVLPIAHSVEVDRDSWVCCVLCSVPFDASRRAAG